MQSGNTNRIIKNTVFLYIRMAIVMVVTLFTVRVAYKQLGQVDYGVYSVVGGVVFALSFISSVLSSASVRFFAFDIGNKDFEHLKSTFSTMLVSYLVVIGVIIVIAETIGLWFVNNKLNIPAGYETTVNCIYQTSILAFVAVVFSSPFSAMIVAFEEMNVIAVVGILDAVLKLMAAYLVVFVSGNKLLFYGIFLCLAYLCTASVYVFYTLYKHTECHCRITINKSLFKSIFNYSSWTMFGAISGLFSTHGLNILLNIYFGPIVNSAYSVSHQISSAVSSFGSSFYSAVRPGIIKSYANGDKLHLNRLFDLSNKILASLMLIIIIPLFVEMDYVLKIWLGEIGDYTAIFSRIILIYTFILILSSPITTIIQAANGVKKYHTIVDSFTLISLPFIYLSFKLGGDAYYAYIILVIVFLLAHFMRLLVLKQYFVVSIRHYIFSFLLPMLVIAIIATFSAFMLKRYFTSDSFISFIIIVFLSILISSSLAILTLFTKAEREAIIVRVKSRVTKK